MKQYRITQSLGQSFRPESLSWRTEELRDLARRSRETVLLAAVTGAATGAMVRGFEFLVEVAYEFAVEEPWYVAAFLPGVGLVLAAIVLRTIGGGTSSATSDEYLRAFHDREYGLAPRAAIARLMAAVCTLGTGGALGMEGPSLYGGAAIGAFLERKLPRRFRGADHRVLLAAGAAAGVAAVFKAPATGAIFAIEVPYRGDLARRMLLPALVASATGYLTFVTIMNDTRPLLSVGVFEGMNFELIDLVGAILVGIAAALGARLFAYIIRRAKKLAHRPVVPRLILGTLVLAALYFAAMELTGMPLSMGAGYEVFRDWLFVERDLTLWVIAAIFMIRVMATAVNYASGGVGGLFVPLVVGGGLTGRFVAEIVHPSQYALYTLLGIAAFLGAGYRVPLAAVMFVAETTGRPNFVVPALFAAVAAELVMGEQSITAVQRRSTSDAVS